MYTYFKNYFNILNENEENFVNLINFKPIENTNHEFQLVITFNSNNKKKISEKLIQQRPFITLAKNNPPFESILISNTSLGTILLQFLNEYNSIIKLLNFYIEKINLPSNACEMIDIPFFYEDILQELIEDLKETKKINKCSPIIINEIYSFINNFYRSLHDYRNLLFDKIKSVEQEENKSNTTQRILITYKEQYEYLCNMSFYKKITIKFLNLLISELSTLNSKYITSFSSTILRNEKKYSSKNIAKSTRITIINQNIEINNKLKATKYSYTFTSFEDFGNIILYHIIASNKVISKCRNCGNFFIPKKRNDERYCDRTVKYANTKNEYLKKCKDIGRIETNNIFKKEHYEKNKYSQLHKLLYDRIYSRIKSEPNNIDYIKLRDELKQKHKEFKNKSKKILLNKNDEIKNIPKYKSNYEKSIEKQNINKKYKPYIKKLTDEYYAELVQMEKNFNKKYKAKKNKYKDI